MSLGRRREMVDRGHPSLPVVRQCALLGISRSRLNYRRKEPSAEDMSLMVESEAVRGMSPASKPSNGTKSTGAKLTRHQAVGSGVTNSTTGSNI